MDSEGLLFNKKSGVGILTFNRPEKLNAVNDTVLRKMTSLLEQIRYDDEVKVLVLTGNGRAFCVGADVSRLKEWVNLDAKEKYPNRKAYMEPIGAWMLPLVNLGKPTIAAINGLATGAGLSFALGCDIRIASDKAQFGAVWVRVGLVPDFGATQLLPQAVGVSRAFELMYTGDIFDANSAERMDLVSRVVPHDNLMNEALQLAQRVAEGPSIAIEFTKRAVLYGMNHDFESLLEFESRAVDVTMHTDDHREGAAAFLEKRKPLFKGR